MPRKKSTPVAERTTEYVNGLPVMGQKVQVMTSNALTRTAEVAPFEVVPGHDIIATFRLKHKGGGLDNVYSKDDPTQLAGFVRVAKYELVVGVVDDRPEAAEELARMQERVEAHAAELAEEKEREKKRANGEFTFEDALESV